MQRFSCTAKAEAGLITPAIFSPSKWAAWDKPRAAAGKNHISTQSNVAGCLHLFSRIKKQGNPQIITHCEWMECSSSTPLPPPNTHTHTHAERAVLHSIASIIHQAAEKTIHIHKFSRRELWSRWYKRLYGSHHISHSGLINSWMASQRLLAAAHMFQLPQSGQRKK